MSVCLCVSVERKGFLKGRRGKDFPSQSENSKPKYRERTECDRKFTLAFRNHFLLKKKKEKKSILASETTQQDESLLRSIS